MTSSKELIETELTDIAQAIKVKQEELKDVYPSGPIVNRGTINANASSQVTITFDQPFADTNYIFCVVYYSSTAWYQWTGIFKTAKAVSPVTKMNSTCFNGPNYIGPSTSHPFEFTNTSFTFYTSGKLPSADCLWFAAEV